MSFSRFDIPGYTHHVFCRHDRIDNFVAWIVADKWSHHESDCKRLVRWIFEKTTGIQTVRPPERSGFERARTIALRVGMLFGAGLAAAGATYLAGKGFEAYGNRVIAQYSNKTPTFVMNSPTDGSPLCDAGFILKKIPYSEYHYVAPILDSCSNVQASYAHSAMQGHSFVAAGEHIQLAAKAMYLTLSTPLYAAYELPKRLFDSLASVVSKPLAAITPHWKIGEKVNSLFTLTQSTAESIIGKS
ncbi:MAG: hypothetical protein Q8K75_04480 [Chlamydiales bacterium]|nr:hypothetical protein [Chlamydiales bacterium]